MRRLTLLVLGLMCLGTFAAAQMEAPQIVAPNNEIYLGYLYEYADTNGSNVVSGAQLVDVQKTSLNGVDFQFSHYLKNHKSFGYTMDLSRGSRRKVDATGIKCQRTGYLVGPTYRLPSFGFITMNVHALAGADREHFTLPMGATTYEVQDDAWAVMGGVTVDGNLSKHLAIRLGQADFLYTEHYGKNQASFRYTGGIVVRF